MKKVYEINRYEVVNMEIAFQLGCLAEFSKNIDNDIQELEKSLESFQNEDEKYNKDVIDYYKGAIKELEDINTENKIGLYDEIRKIINSKNVISIRLTKDYISVIEFDIANVVGSSPIEDENGKYYIEVEE